jgi:hypothetical protein
MTDSRRAAVGDHPRHGDRPSVFAVRREARVALLRLRLRRDRRVAAAVVPDLPVNGMATAPHAPRTASRDLTVAAQPAITSLSSTS